MFKAIHTFKSSTSDKISPKHDIKVSSKFIGPSVIRFRLSGHPSFNAYKPNSIVLVVSMYVEESHVGQKMT